MLGKLLASVGIGGATVDTILDTPHVELGGAVSGRIAVKGGGVPQEITEIGVEVCTEVLVEANDTKTLQSRAIAAFTVTKGFSVEPGARHELRFEIPLPLFTPVALGRDRSQAWLRTRLDIPMALDSVDNDALVVAPAPVQRDAFAAMEALGFRLYKSDVEHRPRWHGGHGFVQEFEFKPAGYGRGRFDEVELVFQPDGRDGFELLVQVDRSARSLSGFLLEATGMDESWHHVPLPGGLRGPGQSAIQRSLGQLLGL
ncbi:MAG TPA: sporulation protein [Azospirillaceae bacterium]|nr:sporulation protein [Azospirillaceae bacterium]